MITPRAVAGIQPARSELLTTRQLNRATLARQLLLERVDLDPLAALEHLVGLQAQVPHNPYVGLWSRLAGFDPAALSRLLVERALVRIVVMRGTIHLVTADDGLVLRPLAQPVLDRELGAHRDHAPALAGIDLAPVLAAAAPLLAERPRTNAELRGLLAERFPDLDAAALAYACRNHLALVQVPPRGVWGRSGQVRVTTAESWLGRPLAASPSLDDVVLRYLAAFGPATAADVAAWSGLTGIREVLDRLRPRLRAFRDERGRALVDLPDAPRPDPDTPVPPRFLPEYDNVLLSHDDRSRVFDERLRGRPFDRARIVRGSVLLDGFAMATWRPDGPDLVVDHAVPLRPADRRAICAEGQRLLRLLRPDGPPGEVRLAPV